ncbi:MAG: two-component regulator propeller domain-containing protein [Rikenellaceae bacterium]
MNYTKGIILTIIALFSLHLDTARGAEIGVKIERLNNRYGLVSDSVQAIVRDKDGFIWIGTAEGLCRYDGSDIKYYTPFVENGYSRIIRHLAVDDDNLIWISTNIGLYTFDPRREVFTEIPEVKGVVRDVAISPDNTIIAHTPNKLYHCKKQPDGEIEVETIDNINFNFIPTIFFDSDRHLWVCSNQKQVDCYSFEDGDIGERVTTIDLKANKIKDVNTIFEDSDGHLFAGLWQGGLFEIVREGSEVSFRRINFDRCETKISDTAIIKFITQDAKSDRYWVGTTTGLYIVTNLKSPKYVQHISTGLSPSQLSNEELNCALYTPDTNHLYVGTMVGGVNIIDLNPGFITQSSLNDTLYKHHNNAVQSIYDDGEHLWLGVGSTGLVLVDKATGEESHYQDLPILNEISPKANSFNAIIRLKHHDQIWLGSRYDAVYIVDIAVDNKFNSIKPTGIKHIASGANAPLPHRSVLSLYEDYRGNVWIGDFRNLVIATMVDGEWVFSNINDLNVSQKIPAELIVGISGDGMGRIWIATRNGGVYRIDNTHENSNDTIEVKHYPPISDLENITQSIYCDSTGRVWVGTSGLGVFQYNRSKDKFICKETRYSDEIISVISIAESNETLFFGTNSGVYSYSLNNHQRDFLLRYTTEDGLSSNVCQGNSIFAGSQGKIYVGTNNGYSTIDAKIVYKREPATNIKITDIRVSNASILYPNTTEYLTRDESGVLERLTVPFSENTISLYFTNLTTKDPEQTHYSYRLIGLNNEWVEANPQQRSVVYSNLPAGRYTFEVKGSTPDAATTTLQIQIQPAPYASWWAWTIYILITIVVLLFIARSIVDKIKLNNELRYERYKQMNAERLNNSKLQFFTNISHELLTPLMIINYGVNELGESGEKSSSTLSIIKGNISRLSRLLEQILEFRKAESGSLKLKVSRGDLALYIDQLTRDNFAPYLAKKNISLSLNTTPDSVEGYFDSDKIDKIIYNLVTNAIKYNVEGGFIEITIEGKQCGDELTEARVSVRNSGAIITKEQQSQLFKRFYDGEFRQYKTKGWGIGLSLVQDLVTLHRGTISVSSDTERGTCFSFNIPLLSRSYDEEQIFEADATTSDNLVEQSFDQEELGDVTLLLVEDNEDLSKMMCRALEHHYKVLYAADGEQGIAMAQEHNPDIIVSDVVMPNASGYTLCHRLKSDIETSHIPIILLTAMNNREGQLQGLNIGAEAYLHKPIEIDLLVAQINSLLSAHRRRANSYSSVESSVSKLNFSSLDSQLLENVIQFIDSNISDTELDVSKMAQHLNISNSTLYRKIKLLTDLSPNEFVRDRRLSIAYKLLESDKERASISEVAFITGFGSARYFTLCFKNKYGYPPSQLKAQEES